MNLEQITEIAWLVTRPSPSSQPTNPGCLGGIIANQTISDKVSSQFNSILPIMFTLISILIIRRVLSSFITSDDDDEQHSRNNIPEDDDEGRGFLHRLFYRKRKRKEDGDSQE